MMSGLLGITAVAVSGDILLRRLSLVRKSECLGCARPSPFGNARDWYVWKYTSDPIMRAKNQINE
jgi:hypothetical protein